MLYVKYHKNSLKGFESKNVFLKFGVFGIKCVENGELTEKHIIIIKKLFATIFKKSSKL
jgi:hypothetical protein